MAAFMLANPRSPTDQRRNVLLALVLQLPGAGSVLQPGADQRQLLVAGNLLCLILGGEALFRLVFTVAMRNSGPVNRYGAWFGILGLVLWLYAVIDAVVTAQKRGAGRTPRLAYAHAGGRGGRLPPLRLRRAGPPVPSCA